MVMKEVGMKVVIFSLFVVVSAFTPAVASAYSGDQLLELSSTLVDQLNAGEVDGMDARISELSAALVETRTAAASNAVTLEQLELVEADLNGAREFISKLSA